MNLQEQLNEKIHSFAETLAFISFEAGSHPPYKKKLIAKNEELNGSVGMYNTFITWAHEFEDIHSTTNWGIDENSDWLETIEKYTDDKIKSL